MYKKTKALVLREVTYKDADKILTVLTADEGKITVAARSCRRKNSQIAAAAQLFAYSEMSLFYNQGRYSLKEAANLQQFVNLREDLSAFSLAAYFAQLLELLSDADSPDPQLLTLGLNALSALCAAKLPQTLIKSAFELRLLCLAGFSPNIASCVQCGNQNPKSAFFDLSGGCLSCENCGEFEHPLSQGALAAMRHITHCKLEKLFSFTLRTDSAKNLAKICEAYVCCQLERGFHTLDFYKSVNLQNGVFSI